MQNFPGGFAPLDPPTRGLCPLAPRWGLRPPTPAAAPSALYVDLIGASHQVAPPQEYPAGAMPAEVARAIVTLE